MKKILVTGACGYIGSHTLVDLIENNFAVVSIDNLSNSYEESLVGVEKITGKKIKNYTINLCDLAATKKIFKAEKNISGIIHFAAKKYVNESVEQPLLYYQNNLQSLINVLECTKMFAIENFVFSSSCSVYGNAEKLPVDENYPIVKAESPYANTKIIGEQIIRDFIKQNYLKTTLLRYFNPAGAHLSGFLGEKPKQQPFNIVPRITGTALGKYENFYISGNDYPTKDGTCIRDYIHVSDIAHAHTLALKWLLKQKETSLCEVFNLGTGNGISVLQMVKAFENANGIKLNYRFKSRRAGDVIAVYANNSKAKNMLKWELKHNLEDIMKSAWLWDKQ